MPLRANLQCGGVQDGNGRKTKPWLFCLGQVPWGGDTAAGCQRRRQGRKPRRAGPTICNRADGTVSRFAQMVDVLSKPVSPVRGRWAWTSLPSVLTSAGVNLCSDRVLYAKGRKYA